MVEDVVGQLKCSISDNQFIFGGVLLHFSMVKKCLQLTTPNTVKKETYHFGGGFVALLRL